MEIEFKEDKIIFDRELSLLDSFVLSFTEHLETNNIKYVIISGYVAILFGRSRMSEDVDIFIEHELKFVKNDLDRYSLQNRKHVKLRDESLYLSPLELQIPYKLFLGSEKDIEDARFLFKLFKDNLNIVLLKMFLSKLKVSDNQVKRYLGGFDDN